jgi:hypothetical protein
MPTMSGKGSPDTCMHRDDAFAHARRLVEAGGSTFGGQHQQANESGLSFKSPLLPEAIAARLNAPSMLTRSPRRRGREALSGLSIRAPSRS